MSNNNQLFSTAVAGEQWDGTLLPLPGGIAIPLIVSNRHGNDAVITMKRYSLNPDNYHRTSGTCLHISISEIQRKDTADEISL